jgi:ArsR family transcriptional regulator
MEKAKVTFNYEKLQVSTELMRAMAHPLRLRILEFIDTHGVINVNKIYNNLQIEQSITSQHLRILKVAGVVNSEREGKFIHYSINYDIIHKVENAIRNFIAKNK